MTCTFSPDILYAGRLFPFLSGFYELICGWLRPVSRRSAKQPGEGPPKKTEPTVICNLLHVDGALAVIHHVFFMPLLLVLALVVLRRNGAAADKVQSARIVTIVTIVFAFVDLLVAGQG